MQATLRSFIPSLVVVLGLSACDSELDDAYIDADELDLAEPELPPTELELTTGDTAETVSCNLNLPTHLMAGWDNVGQLSSTLTGIGSGNYAMEVSMTTYLNLQWWELWVDGDYIGYGLAPSDTVEPFYAENGSTIEFDLTAPAGAFPGWQYHLTFELYSYPNNQLVCSDSLIMTIPSGCIGVAWWYQQPFPTPWDDGAHCYVAALPPGAQGFMYQGNWYVTPTNGNQCSIGSFDGANCYIGRAPMNREGFIWNGALYYNL
jgi:hypothetical protein